MIKSLKNWQQTACVVGVDFGDSGKGRLVDDLAQNAHIIARYNGGSNTGHTVKNKFGKFALHIVPSGIFNQKAINIIGRGVALDLESLIDDEFIQLKKAKVSWKNLIIDEQATLTMPWHKLRDGLREEFRQTRVGTTKRGVGPTYADRTERVGIRIKDLVSTNFSKMLKNELEYQSKIYNLKLSFSKIYSKYQNYARIIKPFINQTIPIINSAISSKKNILFEGAQGWFLDIDSGTYPYVTSSNSGVVGIWRSFDLHPAKINNVIGITKAYLTRVGNGPLPTKIKSHHRKLIIEKGQEVGTTSGRTRDPGWLDLVLLKTACEVNGVSNLAITKLDVLSGFKKIKICTAYKINGRQTNYLSGDADYLAKCQPVYKELNGWQEDLSQIRDFTKLPKNAQNYVKFIEKFINVPVSFIGVGPERDQVIYV